MWWHTPAVPVLRGWAEPILNYTGRPWKGGGREGGRRRERREWQSHKMDSYRQDHLKTDFKGSQASLTIKGSP